MKLLHMLRATSPTPLPSRERLKSALAARAAAQGEVVKAREMLGRLQAVVAASDQAARAAAHATCAADEFRKQWVRGGCKHSESRELQALTDAAAEAAKAAQTTSINAAAVCKELARAQDAVQSRQNDIRHCEAEISIAVGVILAEEAAPLLLRFERIAEEYRAVRIEIKALQRVLDPGRYEDAMAKSDEGARLVDAALGRGAILSWDKERDAAQAHDFVEGARGRDEAALEKLMARWRERAQALRANPDAQL